MKRAFTILFTLLCAISITGCKCAERERIQVARQLILEGNAECVLLTGTQMIIERGRGISPLLNIYDYHCAEMNNAHIVDKVIGRATAAIAICGNVRHVHGELMSEDAIVFLEEHGIRATYTQCVPRILNRTMTGVCPMELTVEDIEDPKVAVRALREKLNQFKMQKGE